MELRGDKHKKRNGVSPGKRNSLTLISERYIYMEEEKWGQSRKKEFIDFNFREVYL